MEAGSDFEEEVNRKENATRELQPIDVFNEQN